MRFTDPVATGNTADIHLHGGDIYKVLHTHLAHGAARREAAKQRLAYASGLPVPKVLGVLRLSGRQVIRMEHIPGESLGEIVRRDPSKTASCLALSVDLQLAVHAKSVPALEPMRGLLAHKLRAAALEPALRGRLLARAAALPARHRLCHGDYHLHNLILAPGGRTVIIDWVDATAGSPCADVCRSYLLYTQHAPHLAEPYLRLYCEKSAVPSGDILALLPLMAGARLGERLPPHSAAALLRIARQCP